MENKRHFRFQVCSLVSVFFHVFSFFLGEANGFNVPLRPKVMLASRSREVELPLAEPRFVAFVWGLTAWGGRGRKGMCAGRFWTPTTACWTVPGSLGMGNSSSLG